MSKGVVFRVEVLCLGVATLSELHEAFISICCWPATEAGCAVCAAASSKHRSSGSGSGSAGKPKHSSGSKSRHSSHSGSQPKAQPLDRINKQVGVRAQPCLWLWRQQACI